MLGLVVASAGAASVGGLLLLTAVGLGVYARHWLSLARRSRVGARSEDEVQRALAALEAEGWRLRHSLPWRGHGDIDSVAIAPTGIAVAIETKTRAYDTRHLARVREQAARLSRRRRRWARDGALAVMCLRQGAWRRARRRRRFGGLDRPVVLRHARRGGGGSESAFSGLGLRDGRQPRVQASWRERGGSVRCRDRSGRRVAKHCGGRWGRRQTCGRDDGDDASRIVREDTSSWGEPDRRPLPAESDPDASPVADALARSPLSSCEGRDRVRSNRRLRRLPLIDIEPTLCAGTASAHWGTRAG